MEINRTLTHRKQSKGCTVRPVSIFQQRKAQARSGIRRHRRRLLGLFGRPRAEDGGGVPGILFHAVKSKFEAVGEKCKTGRKRMVLML